MLKCLGGGSKKKIVAALEEVVWVLKVIIFHSLVGTNTNFNILISLRHQHSKSSF